MSKRLNQLLVVSLLVFLVGAIAAQANPFAGHSRSRAKQAQMYTAASPQLYTIERTIGTTPAWVPTDVAVDGDGYLFVIDAKTNSIRKLPPTGAVDAISRTFGSEGTGVGQFLKPVRIGVDTMNYVYVLDQEKQTVQKFTRTGIFVSQWRVFGDPVAMAVSTNNLVYILTSDNRVHRYTPSGSQVNEYQLNVNQPSDLAVDNAGNMYVLGSDGIDKYNSSGGFISQIVSGQSYENYYWDGRLAIQGSKIYLGNSALGPGERAIVSFTLAGVPSTLYSIFGGRPGQVLGANGIAVDDTGAVYIADMTEARVQKFLAAGTYSRQWGWVGTANGQFRGPIGTAGDSAGNIYVIDCFNYRIQKFNSAGTFISKWGTYGTANGGFQLPMGIAVGFGGAVYVSDMMASRVQKFTAAGVFSSKFGAPGVANGQFQGAGCIAAAADGKLYVADMGNSRVQYFTAGGAYSGQFGSSVLHNPWGVAVTATQVFVTDDDLRQVFKFSLTGTPAGSFGSEGDSYGQFSDIKAISADSTGKLWVADAELDRIQQFTPAGALLNVVSPASAERIHSGQPMGVTAIAGNKLLISDIIYQQVYVMAPAASPAAPTKVAVTKLAAAAAPNGGAQISFALSGNAAVDIEIDNIAGRPVRYLSGGVYNQGLNTALWNGRNSSGAKVPAGTYLVRLTARNANGDQASSVARLNLAR